MNQFNINQYILPMLALPHFLENRAEIELLVADFDLTTDPVTHTAPHSLDKEEIIAEIRKERQEALLNLYHSTRFKRASQLKEVCAIDIANTGSLF